MEKSFIYNCGSFFALCLFSLLIASCTRNTEKRTTIGSAPSRIYTCTSEATLLKGGTASVTDKQKQRVDFNASSDAAGPSVKHALEGTDIFVEFWSNDPNGAAATGFVKGLLLKTQWSGGFSNSQGLPGEFEIPLRPYELSKDSSIKFKISCAKQ